VVEDNMKEKAKRGCWWYIPVQH